MIRHGEAPFLECSSKGDKRFSAFFARIKNRNNDTIENIYQASKIFPGNITGLSPKEAKGKKAINQEWCSVLYDQLWKEYLKENLYLIDILLQTTGVSDIFGQPGHCCQATSLWNIKHEIINYRNSK